jgi:hypothetical protein
MRYFLIAMLAVILTGCRNETAYDLDALPAGGILLNKWQILGPFPANGNDHFLEVDNLRRFGFDEPTISYDEFVRINPKNVSAPLINQLIKSDDYRMDFNRIFNYTNSTSISGNVYCACLLHSDKERKLKLNFSSDDGSKVWLNHQLLFTRDRIGGIKYYEFYIDLDLRQGDNFLLIKVNNKASGWELFAAVEKETQQSAQRAKRTFALEFGSYFLQKSVITNDSLSFVENLPPEQYVLTLATSDDRIIRSDTVLNVNTPVWNISALRDGLYSSTLQARGDTFSELFYKGDIAGAIAGVLKKIHRFSLPAGTKRNIDALAYRFRHLMKPENARDRHWDKKMIFELTSLTHYYRNLSNGLDPESDFVGGMLKTYVSQIDNGIQYYQLFVPRTYRKEHPLPLVIELPKFMTRHPSPLETYRFANARLFALFEILADRYNVIILDAGCRTIDRTNMNTIDESDFWEALGDVRKRYSIDTMRLYLRGACLSCQEALKLAVKYPDKFAALSLVAPEFEHHTIKNIYLQQNEPLNYLRNLTNLPIFTIHGAFDPHSPVAAGDSLALMAKEFGIKNYVYWRLPMEFKTYYSEEYFEDIFSFLLKHRLNPSPNEIFFSSSQLKYNKSFWLTLNRISSAENASIHASIESNMLTVQKENVGSYTVDLRTLRYSKDRQLTIVDNGEKIFDAMPHGQSFTCNPQRDSSVLAKNSEIEGPLAHIFTVPFIVVPGTGGNAKENKTLSALADTINTYWMDRYYSGCRIKLDRDITEKDVQHYSLLLLGTPKSNLLFKRWQKKLPVKINSSSVEIGHTESTGSELGFYFIYPNPDNPAAYVGIIGYDNPSAISLAYEDDGRSRSFNDVSNYGWFDFKIWNANTSQTLSSGYFDSFWK